MDGLYRTQVVSHWKTRASTTTFFFFIQGSGAFTAWQTARLLNAHLFISTNWLYFFSKMLALDAYIRCVRTQCIDPPGQPVCFKEFAPGAYPGELAGNVDANFCVFTMRWHAALDQSGRNQIRISPITDEYLRNGMPLSTLIFRGSAFAGVHLATMEISPDVYAIGCIHGIPSEDLRIKKWDYGDGSGRQINRRLRV